MCWMIASAVSNGEAVFGRFECKNAKTLIIDEESTRSVYRDRLIVSI